MSSGYRQPKRLRGLEPRFRNFTLYRERNNREVPWYRVADLKGLDLPRPIVLINGAFDILHSSHMRLIYAARLKAATLVVALDANDKIAKEKGPERPICSWIERANALNYMPVDAIFEIADKKEMDRLVAGLVPDLRVQGAEYANKPSRYPNIPKLLVREGRIHDSEIIQRVRDRYTARPGQDPGEVAKADAAAGLEHLN